MKPRTTQTTTTFTTTTTIKNNSCFPRVRRKSLCRKSRSEETSSRRRRCRANNIKNNDDDFDDGNDFYVKALRDEASRGCSECYFPREKDRAENVFNACFPAFIRSKPFGTALLVGAETGEVVERFVSLCAAFEGEGAKLATVVDVSEKQLDRAMEKVPDVGISGNEKGAKYFQLSEMSLEEVKPYFGPFDAIVFNDTFEQFPEKKRKETLARAANLLKQTSSSSSSSSSGSDEGGVNEATSRIVISSRETREGDESYARLKREELEALVKGLPLVWTEEEAKRGKALDLSSDSNIDNRSSSSNSNSNSNNNNSIGNNNVQNDDNDLDATRVLYLTENYKLAKPLHMRAKVVRGFGRGSAEMGLPTANLDPAEISLNWQKELNDDTVDVKNIPLGVYFGYCQLEGDESGKKIAVLNVGRRPSFVDKKNYENDVTVEVHCVEKNEDGLAFENGKKQFYGETMSVECLGFVRPEMKFNGLDELVTRIKTDVGLSKNSLMKMGI
jgi:riboflavin kinase